MIHDDYIDYQIQFFIATSAEMNNIMVSCDRHFGTSMRAGWKVIKQKFLTVSENDATTPRALWSTWYREQTKKKQAGTRLLHKDIDWFGNSIKDFWEMFQMTLVRYGLIVIVQRQIKWGDCPVRAICKSHPMSPDELNTARTQYPAFHDESTKYPKTPRLHCACRVHKQKVHGGACRIYEELQRIREHLFLKSKHLDEYHYMECMMLSIALFILKKIRVIIDYIDK